eukprot:Gb_24934 [translate_table: standard]
MDPPPPSIRAYALSIEDGQWTQIKEDDLCSYAWNFWDEHVSADEDDLLWGGHECHWHFTETIDVNEEVNNSSATCIQINHWPPLKITHTPSWGWRMENFMCVYATVTW